MGAYFSVGLEFEEADALLIAIDLSDAAGVHAKLLADARRRITVAMDERRAELRKTEISGTPTG